MILCCNPAELEYLGGLSRVVAGFGIDRIAKLG